MASLGTNIKIKEGHKSGSALQIGGKEIPIEYNGSHYVVDITNIGDILGNHNTQVHIAMIPKNETVKLSEEDDNRSIKEFGEVMLEVYNAQS